MKMANPPFFKNIIGPSHETMYYLATVVYMILNRTLINLCNMQRSDEVDKAFDLNSLQVLAARCLLKDNNKIPITPQIRFSQLIPER
jgi:ribonucleotide reductase alpha subunit